jgi:hypothetical protein
MNRYVISGFALLASALSYAPAVSAQAPQSAPVPVRNSLGQPNLEGNWVSATITPQTRLPEFGDRGVYTPKEVAEIEGTALRRAEAGDQRTDPNSGPPPGGPGVDIGAYNRAWLDPGLSLMRVRGEPRNSLIRTPDGLPPLPKAGSPITETGLAEIKRVREATTLRIGFNVSEDGNVLGSPDVDQYTENPENRSLAERCITFGRNGGAPMFPNGAYNNHTRIVQAPDHVAIEVEMVHDTRIIRLNDRKHLPSNIRPYFGDSVGWYDGDALVIETTNIPKAQAFFGSWENLKVTERLSRTTDNRLAYSFTIEDPTIWDKPWAGEYEFGALDGDLYEYACHEGNYAMPGILAGSRVEDSTRGKGQRKPARQ